jgi:hypothetical protein
MIIDLDSASARSVVDDSPAHINPMLWQQSLGLARQISARVFRDGGTPGDAVLAVGLVAPPAVTWDKAVELIAAGLSRGRTAGRKAAA